MKVLFDHGVSAELKLHFAAYEVHYAREFGWEELSNGKLLEAARCMGFGGAVTTDTHVDWRMAATKRGLVGLVIRPNDRRIYLPHGHLISLKFSSLKAGEVAEYVIPRVKISRGLGF